MRITAIATHAVRWPIAGDGAARGRSERAAVLLEVRGDGVIGLGEAAPLPGMSHDTLDDAAGQLAAFARSAPFELAGVDDALARAGAATGAARFAIETALLDALGRARGVALSALLGAPPARVALAAVVDDAAAAGRAYEAGVRCLKIKLYAEDDVARVHAIAAAAPDAELRIDANRTWPRAELPARLARLAVPRIAYIEEPCRDAHLALDQPGWFALDESVLELTPAELARALAAPHLVALVLKPTVLGGIARVLALAAQARAAGVAPVISHGLEGPIGTAACAELAVAVARDPGPARAQASHGPRRDLSPPAGLAPHAALAGWRLAVPQLAADHVHPAAPGLGFADLELAGAVRACPGQPA